GGGGGGEAARRGREGSSRWYGEDSERVSRYAWYAETGGDEPAPAGRLLPNAFGLFDMHGNVGEWCQDAAGLYVDGPEDARGPEIVLSKDYRVVRSGQFPSKARPIRSPK